MQEQLKRIKNKDLSQLDDRIFSNFDKADTINSTLQNLQKFQNFLLNQIGEFQQQAKQKNKQKQVKQVISQNCETLRQSILRVLPNLQSSRSKLRQQNEQYTYDKINYFNNSKIKNISQANDNSQTNNNIKTIDINQIKNIKTKNNIQTKNNIKTKNILGTSKNVDKFECNIRQLRNEIEQIRNSQKQSHRQLMHECQILAQNKLYEIMKQNTSLKRNNSKLNQEKQLLHQKIKNLKQQLINKTNNIPTNLIINQKYATKPQTKDNLRKEQVFVDQNSLSTIKIDMTKLQASTYSSKRNQNQCSGTGSFRQYNTISYDSIMRDQSIFRSIQLYNQKQNAPNLPRPLRRNSLYSDSKKNSQSSLASKHRLPLQQKKFYSAIEQNILKSNDKLTKEAILNQKRSNHDLMRKSKSNFFKKEDDFTNLQINIAKIKGLQKSPQNCARRSGSKQKLKIFSLI